MTGKPKHENPKVAGGQVWECGARRVKIGTIVVFAGTQYAICHDYDHIMHESETISVHELRTKWIMTKAR